jgi:hypothetical protein
MLRPLIFPCQLAAMPATQPAGMLHDPRSTSAVVLAYSGSQTISSNSTPNASPTKFTASMKTSVAFAVMAGNSGSSIGRANPTGSSVSGES